MRTELVITAAMLTMVSVLPAEAENGHENMSEEMMAEHGGGVFHMLRLELDSGISSGDSVSSWDLDGWVGTDGNKLWLKSEGELFEGEAEKLEVWALYSRNIATFWDAQLGIRYDLEPQPTAYLALGFEGLAPYFFETEAHLFVSEDGDVSARLRQENDVLITQKFILQPYAEADLYIQEVEQNETGSGLGEVEIGLQARYEFTKKFAPYVDVRYSRKFGGTSDIAESNGDDADELTTAVGVRLMF